MTEATKRCCTVAAICSVLCWPPHLYGQNRYPYLVDSANEMLSLNSDVSRQSTQRLAQASARACQALRVLLDDPLFMLDLDRIASTQAHSDADREELSRDLGRFVASFLSGERKLLKDAGLRDEAIDQILLSASRLQDVASAYVDPEQIYDAVRWFRDDVCEGAERLSQLVDANERNDTFRKWAFRIGGAVMVAVDVGAGPATGGVTVASTAIGAAIMTWDQ